VFRSLRLSYGQTVLCVLLRDELRRFEEEDLRNERCVIEEAPLLNLWIGSADRANFEYFANPANCR
jgi:hypothetical protein